MDTFYLIAKVIGLLAVLTLPLVGSKKSKKNNPRELSNLGVNREGYLEYLDKVKGAIIFCIFLPDIVPTGTFETLFL